MPFTSSAERIWDVAAHAPNSIAVTLGGKKITYSELIRRSSVLAGELANRFGGEASRVIAVCANNAVDLTISALAAWRVGCAYLPLDPDAPPERSLHMLSEAGAICVLISTPTSLSAAVRDRHALTLEPFTQSPIEVRDDASNLPNWKIGPDDLAYVIYTSGSTGTPKGASITHSNLNSLLLWYNQEFRVSSEDRASQIMALTFDVSVIEIWAHLLQGACVCALDRALLLFPERLRDHLVEQQITLCEVPALVAEQLIKLEWPKHTKLRYLHTGGETLRVFPAPGLPFRVVNNYGPSECTVVTTSTVVPERPLGDERLPSIGRPISGAKVFIWNAESSSVPDGERGEIVIGGKGVGAGYICRPDLTRERFPISTPGSRLYRTGDLGRKLASGDIEFCGRIDDQIKLRGHRIEPAEISAVLQGHSDVRSCVVTTSGEGITKQLIAYVVLNENTQSSDLKAHLSARLPTYMIPDCFVRIEALPTTLHGKVDVSALPAPGRDNVLDSPIEAVGPDTQIQDELTSIMSKLLGRRDFGIHDNFFRLGANSLLAARLIANVEHTLGIELSLSTVFQFPTIAGLASEIEERILQLSPLLPSDA